MSTQSTTPPKTRISAEMFTQLQKNMNETRRAFDAFSNPIARLGVGTDSLLEGTQYPLTRLSFNYILLQSLYRSNWIARKVVDAVAEDMTKNWVRVDTEMNPNQIQAFDQTIKKTATRAQLLTTMKWGRLFGGAAAIMVIEGHEEQLEEELDFEDVELGSFKGLIPLDRWSGISPSGALCSDINRPFDFGLPEFYTVQPNNGSSFKIHCSRVLRFIGHDLPVWEKQVEQYWGISVIEPMFEELKKFDNTSWNIANLVFRANIIALRQKGLDQMLSGLGTSAQAQKNFYASLEAQSRLLSSQGLLILPEDGGIEEHSYSFGGMKEVYESFKENIAVLLTFRIRVCLDVRPADFRQRTKAMNSPTTKMSGKAEPRS
jgi:phage-related protein (TIGR01555 family)